MITIRDFLELCAIDWADVLLYDLNTEKETHVNVEHFGELDDDILDAEVVSWDYGTNEGERVICLNYEA